MTKGLLAITLVKLRNSMLLSPSSRQNLKENVCQSTLRLTADVHGFYEETYTLMCSIYFGDDEVDIPVAPR